MKFRKSIAGLLAIVATALSVPLFSCGGEKGKKMELNELFCDHMVLQAEKPVRVFGTGDGNATVKVNGKEGKAKSENGKWLVELPSLAYGGPYEMEIGLNGKKKTLTDVYFGDVFLCAGQSNMQFKMKQDTSEARAKRVKNDKIRYFSLDSLDVYERYSPKDGWVQASTITASDEMSALGFYTAVGVSAQNEHAVGLIGCYQGASVIESWLPEALADKPAYNEFPVSCLHSDHTAAAYAKWNENHGTLYHYMFEKILPFSMSHVLWYQGESNTTEIEATYYADMVEDLITRWRSDLQDANLPFVLIQIADYDARSDSGWTGIQTAQASVASKVNGVSLVVSKDVCATDNIHPSKKKALADRVVNAILGEK